MTKDQETIKEQAAQITNLTAKVESLKWKVESLKSDLAQTKEFKERYDNELRDMHATFDLLGIPTQFRNSYRDLSANARLTLFLAQTNGITVAQPKDEG